EVLEKFVEPSAAPLIAGDMRDESDIAEFAASRLRGLMCGFAAIDSILLRHFQMRREFFFELTLFARLVGGVVLVVAMKGRLHASLSFLAGSSTPAIASVSCAHFERSASSRFLPAAVSL